MARWTKLYARIMVVSGALACGCAADGDVADSGTGQEHGSEAGTAGTSGTNATSASTADESGAEGNTGGSGESGAEACVLPPSLDCDDPEPILQQDGSPSGFERCSDDFVHRVAPVTCIAPTSTSTCVTPNSPEECQAAGDCLAQPYGACVQREDSSGGGCECVYGCATDADCDAGRICACGDMFQDGPRCVLAGCASDDACEGLCGVDVFVDGCGIVNYQLACLDADSECRSCCTEEFDCYGNLSVGTCGIVGGAWACNDNEICQDCG